MPIERSRDDPLVRRRPRGDAGDMELSTRIALMYATAHPETRPLARGRPIPEGTLHVALLTTAAVIVGSFLIGVLLVVSVMLAGPLPMYDGGTPIPQMVPQPSATAGMDA
jgi:hypothetical protein